jgi:hypothetical protein
MRLRWSGIHLVFGTMTAIALSCSFLSRHQGQGAEPTGKSAPMRSSRTISSNPPTASSHETDEELDGGDSCDDGHQPDNSCRGMTYGGKRQHSTNPPAVIGPPNCPSGMVFVTAGWRIFRRSGKGCATVPQWGEVSAFCMDQNEVSAGEYSACVKAGACARPSECNIKEGTNPRLSEICTRFSDAQDYCAWRGHRLPSVDEWLRAANNGELLRRFPWGNDLIDTPKTCSCRTDDEGPCETVRDTQDMSFHGVRDLAANASEWVTPYFCMGHDWERFWPPTNGAPCWGGPRVLAPDFEVGVPRPCGFRCAADPMVPSNRIGLDASL